jgi:hypothetical protein
MMRAASFLAVVIGALAAALCFLGLSAESLPYPDPTPAMLAAQAKSMRGWQMGLLASLIVLVAGAFAVRRTRKRSADGS